MINRPVNSLILILLSLVMIGATDYPDPTRPPNFQTAVDSQDTTPTNLILTAIFTYPTFNMAIINGNAYKQGDKLGEYTITRIALNTVELSGPENSTQELTLTTSVKK